MQPSEKQKPPAKVDADPSNDNVTDGTSVFREEDIYTWRQIGDLAHELVRRLEARHDR